MVLGIVAAALVLCLILAVVVIKRSKSAKCGESEEKGRLGIEIGVGVGIGSGIGAAFGVAMDNIALGVAIGPVIGIAVGIAFWAARKPETDKDG